MAADVEQEALVVDGAADAADIDRVLLDHDDRRHFLGQAIGGGETGGPRADDEDFGIDAQRGARHAHLGNGATTPRAARR